MSQAMGGERRADRVCLAGNPTEVEVRVGDQIAWRDPWGLGGVTAEAVVRGLLERDGRGLYAAHLDVAPSVAIRALIAGAEADGWTTRLLPTTPGERGLGGPVIVTGYDLERAAREGRLVVRTPTATTTPEATIGESVAWTGWYSIAHVAWQRHLGYADVAGVREVTDPAPGAVAWREGGRRLALVTEVMRGEGRPTSNFSDFVRVGTVGRHVRTATADDLARAAIAAAASATPLTSLVPSSAKALADRLAGHVDARSVHTYSAHAYAHEPSDAWVPMSRLTRPPPSSCYQGHDAPSAIASPTPRPIDWAALRDRDKPYESMARDLERRIEAHRAEVRARARRATADPYAAHRVALEARGVEPRSWRIDQIDAAAARAWVMSPWVRGFSYRLSDTDAPSLDALFHDAVRRGRREDERRAALRALLLTRPLAPAVGADGYEVAPPRHVTQAGPRQIVGGTRCLEEHAPAILAYAWEQTHFCYAPHVTPHQLQEAFQAVLDEMSRTRAPMPDLDEPYDAYVDRLTAPAPFLCALPSYWPEDAWEKGGPRARWRPLGVEVSDVALRGWRPSWEPYAPPADPYAAHRRRLARTGVEQAR